jgi:hypothetical protein
MLGEKQQIPPGEQSDQEAEQQRIGMEALGHAFAVSGMEN